jgi:hypothetical protein
MNMHVIILSGMDAYDTTSFLIDNNFKRVQVLENQIQRYTRIIGKKVPVRISIWVALNTKFTQQLLYFIKYRIKNIIFLYDINKPLTLIRAKGWWNVVSTYQKKVRMILCSPIITSNEKSKAYNNMISHIANTFTNENIVIPHYTTNLNTIFKKFLHA